MTMQAMTGKTEGRHSTLDEVLAYIHKVDWRGSVPGLSRIDTLLGLLGHPERHVKYVHVTGTNGKGSTCAMLASVLRAAGYKTGLYTSPYIFRFNERMQINGAPIPDDTLCALVEELRPLADRMADPPTEFELVTAIGLTWFAREACDIVVCEVGMGGEFDATNVIPAPEAAVLTNIGLDHTSVLGNTVETIAATKAGIIKPGCHAVLYPCAPSVQEVVAVRCRAAGAPLTAADFDALSLVSDTLEGQIFNYGPYKGLRLPLLGGHQLRNAAVALTTIDVLRQRGWHIDESAVRQGLAQTAWPGRFQVVRRQPTIILDGGHNPQCMVSLAAAILCAVLAFRFAVPLKGTEEQSLPDGQTLSAYTRVDLNTADVDALCTLPGVGESRARAIVAYRQQYGPFAQVADAADVPGLTEDIVASWAGQATVR